MIAILFALINKFQYSSLFIFFNNFTAEKNKLFEVDGPNDYRVDRMYMEDKTGVYVYQQDCSTLDAPNSKFFSPLV